MSREVYSYLDTIFALEDDEEAIQMLLDTARADKRLTDADFCTLISVWYFRRKEILEGRF